MCSGIEIPFGVMDVIPVKSRKVSLWLEVQYIKIYIQALARVLSYFVHAWLLQVKVSVYQSRENDSPSIRAVEMRCYNNEP